MTEDPRITILRKQIEDSVNLVSGTTELAMSILEDKNGLRTDNVRLRSRLIHAYEELQLVQKKLDESRKQLEAAVRELQGIKASVSGASGL